MRRIGKKLANARKNVSSNQELELKEAIDLAKKVSYTNFDSSLTLSLNLNIDTKKVDQQLRGSVALPHGIGKKTRVLIASDDENSRKEAQRAGADIICDRFELEEILNKNKYNFDVIIVEPRMMPLIGKYGKKLGPKGLMPNPKIGTVTTNIFNEISEWKKGKVKFKADKDGNVHTLIGKCSMETDKLVENADKIINTIKRAKPSGAKGVYMQKITIAPTMGPSVNIKISN